MNPPTRAQKIYITIRKTNYAASNIEKFIIIELDDQKEGEEPCMIVGPRVHIAEIFGKENNFQQQNAPSERLSRLLAHCAPAKKELKTRGKVVKLR